MAAVNDSSSWHHITPDGRDTYIDRYAWCGNFQGGRCTVRASDSSYLHITTDGRPVCAARWRYAGDYRDGFAVVQAGDGRSTHVDLAGHVVHGRWFIDLDTFHKGFARARDEDGWMHVAIDGRPIYTRRFAAVEPFYNRQARVERFDGALEVIDESGAVVLELRPPLRSEFAALSGDMVGFWRTQTIAAAVRLGVVEALPATTVQVAERCALRPDGANRLLRALAELQLVIVDDSRWMVTGRGAMLRAEHPLTLADAALEYAGPFSRQWSRLSQVLQSGTDFGDSFAEVARDEMRRAGHHRMLRSYARHDYARVAATLDLRDNEQVIDAGGGLGALAELLLEAHPTAHVTVLDRPEVIEQARRERGIPSRLEFRSTDIFEPWGLKADTVILSRVLHDWDDESAQKILAHARGALPLGGRVVVIEMLLPEGGVAGSLCDLHLLAVLGGRERSAREVERLLGVAGFRLEAVRRVAALPSIVVGSAA